MKRYTSQKGHKEPMLWVGATVDKSRHFRVISFCERCRTISMGRACGEQSSSKSSLQEEYPIQSLHDSVTTVPFGSTGKESVEFMRAEK